MQLGIDDAIGLIVAKLQQAPALDAVGSSARNANYGCDLWISNVIREHVPNRSLGADVIHTVKEAECAPFYDAAWELCRRGILRPGPAFPRSMMMNHTNGEGFSVTGFGREWVAVYDQQVHFPVDPGRFASIIAPYWLRFGAGFAQRAGEAASCYRTLNYFACCSMAGAASESVLLALAIAKAGDDALVLAEYRKANGRRNVTNIIAQGLSAGLRSQLDSQTTLLSFWRDSATHGQATSISEFEAHDAMSRLLRFSQWAADNWGQITAGA